MSGYSGYSMSNNAVDAYDNGERPWSQWSKADILDMCGDKADILRSVKADVLRDNLLIWTGWHHTSKFYNRTNFYAIDYDLLHNITEEMVNQWRERSVDYDRKPESRTFLGNIYYLEWSGTRKHPISFEKKMENVIIEEKGCFYTVKDEQGRKILRKKIGSNGTYVREIDPEDNISSFKEIC